MPVYSVRVVAGRSDADGIDGYTEDALPAVDATIKLDETKWVCTVDAVQQTDDDAAILYTSVGEVGVGQFAES